MDAFNLVRAAVYRRIGGHQPLALRPDDDMKLGKLIKRSGDRQDVALGDELIRVEWYASAGELARGLEKNAFAGVDYNPLLVLAGALAPTALFVWPVIALFVTAGATWALNAGCMFVVVVWHAENSRQHGLPAWHAVALPLTTTVFQFIVWRAMSLTYHRNGIEWRGTHYPLASLRANKL